MGITVDTWPALRPPARAVGRLPGGTQHLRRSSVGAADLVGEANESSMGQSGESF